ncbi:hypothetical protein BC827DRAFT_1227192 [Russula dissimulans]|nr:hypothetical protein BC827DRAFT_1227192 [Russula dissimulans]
MDRRTLALWLACCTEEDVLWAISTSCAFPDMGLMFSVYFDARFNLLLGMHEWCACLKRTGGSTYFVAGTIRVVRW